jgi:hypothetical protein
VFLIARLEGHGIEQEAPFSGGGVDEVTVRVQVTAGLILAPLVNVWGNLLH